jgi:hypothetical protein
MRQDKITEVSSCVRSVGQPTEIVFPAKKKIPPQHRAEGQHGCTRENSEPATPHGFRISGRRLNQLITINARIRTSGVTRLSAPEPAFAS